MARQLHALGEPIGLLALLDTPGPGYPRKRSWPERLQVHLSRMRRLPAAERIAYPLAKLRGKLLAAASGAPPAPAGGRGGPRSSRPHQAGPSDLLESVRHASAAYLCGLATYPGRVTLFRATERRNTPGHSFDDPYNGWGAIAQGGVDVHPIRAGHHTMFQEPGLSELAAALWGCLPRGALPEGPALGGRGAPLHGLPQSSASFGPFRGLA
jgi:thioesterase domain-containing protein